MVETERTWDFIPPSDAHLRPVIVARTDASGNDVRHWEIDGKLRGTVRQPVGRREEWDPARIAPDMAASARNAGRGMETPDASKHMEDVGARLRHMDQLGIDYQMLYPTIFLRRLTDRDETRVAIARGYNRWLADIWTQSEGRLRWAAVLPLSVMEESLAELRWAAAHGANGVFMRGVEEEGVLHDPYFFPLYEEMSRLDVAVTVHIGNGSPEMERLLNHGAGGSPFSSMRIFSVAACHSWILAGIPQEFPRLRIAFVEAAAQWLPYVVSDLGRRFPRPAREARPGRSARGEPGVGHLPDRRRHRLPRRPRGGRTTCSSAPTTVTPTSRRRSRRCASSGSAAPWRRGSCTRSSMPTPGRCTASSGARRRSRRRPRR